MSGPCLCGDPACIYCGNPAAAAYADWVESFADKLLDMDLTTDEAAFIEKTLPALLETYRECRKLSDQERDHGNPDY